MAKCLQHCIGKYIKATGLDDVLLETNIFGKKTIEQILNGTHYVCSLRGFIIIGEAIERLKWKALFEQYGKDKNYDFREIQRLMLEINNKSNENCVSIVDNCIKNIKSMTDDFDQFASSCSRNSEVCKYWEGFLNLCSLMKSLIACDRTWDWQGHLQTVQELLPVFLECDSINYLRYALFYLETMRKLPRDYSEIYKEFMKGKFVVKTKKGSFNAVSPGMKLEQTIQRSKKSTSGIIGQSRQTSYLTEWELVYHEILAISNIFTSITSHGLGFRETDLHHKLSGSLTKVLSDSVDKVFNFLLERNNFQFLKKRQNYIILQQGILFLMSMLTVFSHFLITDRLIILNFVKKDI